MNNENVVEKTSESGKKSSIGYYLKICVTLLVISAVTASLLALVNAITKDRIAANELAVMESALGRIFIGCDEIKQVEGEYDAPVTAVYAVYKGGEKMGYGIQSSPVGFKDVIGLIVGADVNGNCLGVEITSISDTPGVGTKVKEIGFLSGFKWLNGESVNDYDTISGATISSKAVKNGVIAALSLDIFEPDSAELETVEPETTEQAVPEETDGLGAENVSAETKGGAE